MELIPAGINIDFIGKRRIGFAISATALVVCLASIFVVRGINLGIDFSGGVEVQVRFDEPVPIGAVRDAVDTLDLSLSASVQSFGTEPELEYLVRVPQLPDQAAKDVASNVRDTLSETFADQGANVRRVELVGPEVGEELRQQGLLAILFALVGILIYITIRFEVRYALGAIAALVHDVIVVVGVFSLAGKEFNLPTIAALLTIIGYSLNDTIVVFDRIRENRQRTRRGGFAPVINQSINETLSRTALTSITTLLTVVALQVLTQPGSVIHDFAFALTAGVLVGTYSSVFVASPILLLQGRRSSGG